MRPLWQAETIKPRAFSIASQNSFLVGRKIETSHDITAREIPLYEERDISPGQIISWLRKQMERTRGKQRRENLQPPVSCLWFARPSPEDPLSRSGAHLPQGSLTSNEM